MTIPPAPYAIPAPALAQEPVNALLVRFAAALPWLTHPYGLVQTGVEPKTKAKYPQLYLQNGGLQSIDVGPNDRMGALSFIEYDGVAAYDYSDGTNTSGTVTHPLAAVLWLNLKRLDPGRGYDFSPQLIQDYIANGLNKAFNPGRLTVLDVEQRAERIFQRYNFPQERQQLLLHPYAGARIRFSVTTRYLAGADCPAPFVPLTPPYDAPVAPLISGLSDEALFAILLSRGVGRPGHETNRDYGPDYK